MTIRIILKNGVEFSIQCEEFNLERERLTGILVGWTAKGVTENKPVYIDMNQIAAVVRVLSDESPEEKKAAAPAPVEEEARICCPYCGGDNKTPSSTRTATTRNTLYSARPADGRPWKPTKQRPGPSRPSPTGRSSRSRPRRHKKAPMRDAANHTHGGKPKAATKRLYMNYTMLWCLPQYSKKGRHRAA